MEKFKKGIFITSIIMLCLFVAFDVFYLYLLILGEDKHINDTFEVDDIELADGSKYNVIEVNYKRNTNGNGYEMFEVKFTSLLDENQEEIYSQGLQFIANTTDSKLEWWSYEDFSSYFRDYDKNDIGDKSLSEIVAAGQKSFLVKKTGALAWQKNYYAYYITPQIKDKYASVYNYGSSDDFKTVIEPTTYPLSDNPRMLVNMETDKNYQIGLRGSNYIGESEIKDDTSYLVLNNGTFDIDRYYRDYNYYTMAYELYNLVQTLPNGTNQEIVIPFSGDWFNYYRYNEKTKAYEIITDRTEYNKITRDIKSYYAIKVTVSNDGAQYYGDSIFNCMFGSTNFMINADIETSDYYYGRPIINCTIENFQFVSITDRYVALKLKDDFIERYLPYKNYIYIRIVLEMSDFNSRNVRFAGYTGDSGLENFKIIDSLDYPYYKGVA